jgi:hypothetical protein
MRTIERLSRENGLSVADATKAWQFGLIAT